MFPTHEGEDAASVIACPIVTFPATKPHCCN